MLIYVGIGGGLGNGKSTVATRLKYTLEHSLSWDYKINIVPFAQGVKEAAIAMGWDGVKDAKGRRLLQLIGTECGRQCIHPDIWVNQWLNKVEPGTNSILIADDLRFPNEMDAIKKRNGVTILLQGRKKVFRPKFLRHASERGLPKHEYDFTIINDGSIPQLNHCVDEVAFQILQKYGLNI